MRSGHVDWTITGPVVIICDKPWAFSVKQKTHLHPSPTCRFCLCSSKSSSWWSRLESGSLAELSVEARLELGDRGWLSRQHGNTGPQRSPPWQPPLPGYYGNCAPTVWLADILTVQWQQIWLEIFIYYYCVKTHNTYIVDLFIYFRCLYPISLNSLTHKLINLFEKITSLDGR